MEKKVRFKSRWLPWALVAPQMTIVLVFFFWPAGQALYQSVLEEDAFGMSRQFVGWQNFSRLFNDPLYLESFQTTAIFSLLVAVVGLSVALVVAVMADRVWRAANIYKTLLIWPYAVAPAVAGVLWVFIFASPMGVVAYALHWLGVDWNHMLDGRDAMTIVFPLLSPTTFFLLVINVVYAFFDTFAIIDATTHGGPGKSTAILVYKVYYDGFKAMDMGSSAAQSVILMAIVVCLTVVQFRFIERKVQYA